MIEREWDIALIEEANQVVHAGALAPLRNDLGKLGLFSLASRLLGSQFSLAFQRQPMRPLKSGDGQVRASGAHRHGAA